MGDISINIILYLLLFVKFWHKNAQYSNCCLWIGQGTDLLHFSVVYVLTMFLRAKIDWYGLTATGTKSD